MQDYTFPPPVFVLAPPGMPGQTVAAALGQNPAAYDLPECNLELAGTMDVLLRELTGMRAGQLHGVLRALAQLLAGEQTMAAVELARRWLMRHAYLPTADVAHRLAALVAPRQMVTPITAALFDAGATERLIAAFPQAWFVHLEMHPRSHGVAVMAQAGGAAAALLGALDQTVSPPLVDPQELWMMAEDGIARFGAAVPAGQMLELRIEDLLADPEGRLGALAHSIGLPGDAEAMARMCHPERSAFTGPGPFGAHLGGDILALAALGTTLAPLTDRALRGPLPWRPDAAGFRVEVQRLAAAMGYH